MTGQVVCYVRVSTLDQKTDRQLVGVELHRTFTDHASCRDTERPELAQMVAYVREGDTVVVHSMDRLACNLEDLRRLVRELTGKGVRVQFLKESLTFTAEASPMSQLLLNVMGSFAEFERALIRERQREGIAIAKARGIYKGRRRALSPDQVEQLLGRVREGAKKAALAREYAVSRETIYRYLRAAASAGTAKQEQKKEETAWPPSCSPVSMIAATYPDFTSWMFSPRCLVDGRCSGNGGG